MINRKDAKILLLLCHAVGIFVVVGAIVPSPVHLRQAHAKIPPG